MADDRSPWSSPTGDGVPPPPAAPPGWGATPEPTGSYKPSNASGGGWSAPAGWGGPAYGAPKPGVIPLRPLGLGEILDGAVSVVRRYPVPTIGLSAIVAVVQTVVTIAFLLLIPDSLTRASVDTTGSVALSNAEIGGFAAGTLGTVVVTLLGGVVLAGFITAVMGQAALGRDITLGEAWRQVRPRLLPLLGATLSIGLLSAVGLVAGGIVLALGLRLGVVALTVLGGVLLVIAVPLFVLVYVRLAVTTPAMVLEKAGVRVGLKRSWALVRGAFWRTFGILLLAGIIASVVQGVLQLPFALVGQLVVEPTSAPGVVLTALGGGIATAVVGPFSAGVTALLYLDRRMRAEGLDVTLTAAATEGR